MSQCPNVPMSQTCAEKNTQLLKGFFPKQLELKGFRRSSVRARCSVMRIAAEIPPTFVRRLRRWWGSPSSLSREMVGESTFDRNTHMFDHILPPRCTLAPCAPIWRIFDAYTHICRICYAFMHIYKYLRTFKRTQKWFGARARAGAPLLCTFKCA